MFSLGIRKVTVIALIGGIFLVGNLWLMVNWLDGKGAIDWADSFQRVYLTPTALTIVVVLMILLVRPHAETTKFIRHCPVCEHTVIGSKKYCGDCGSKL